MTYARKTLISLQDTPYYHVATPRGHFPVRCLTCTFGGTVRRAHQAVMVASGLKRVQARFFLTEAGREPVKAWLLDLDRPDRRAVGRDLMTLEFGWPVGMPLSRPMGAGLHELRSSVGNGRECRIFFYIDQFQQLILLHAFIKRSRTTPKSELNLARERMKQCQRSNR